MLTRPPTVARTFWKVPWPAGVLHLTTRLVHEVGVHVTSPTVIEPTVEAKLMPVTVMIVPPPVEPEPGCTLVI